MRTFKLTIAYDGTAYAGWQVQCDKTTVQGTLENAIAQVTGESLRVLASGRTDAGVHALGQVVRLRTESLLEPDVLLRAINANLPQDIAVLEIEQTVDDFHPIRDVVRKRYRYVIHDGPVRDIFQRRYAWHYVRGRLDADAMQRAASAFLGKHDFRSFESTGAERLTSVRTVYECVVERGEPFEQGRGVQQIFAHPEDFITLEIEADGFLYNMVRAIVGTLVQVGNGRRPEAWPGEVLSAIDRRRAGPTAPPQGLFLQRVKYGLAPS
jgi:tRNA pseudouridine38-40 synthase